MNIVAFSILIGERDTPQSQKLKILDKLNAILCIQHPQAFKNN